MGEVESKLHIHVSITRLVVKCVRFNIPTHTVKIRNRLYSFIYAIDNRRFVNVKWISSWTMIFSCCCCCWFDYPKKSVQLVSLSSSYNSYAISVIGLLIWHTAEISPSNHLYILKVIQRFFFLDISWRINPNGGENSESYVMRPHMITYTAIRVISYCLRFASLNFGCNMLMKS